MLLFQSKLISFLFLDHNKCVPASGTSLYIRRALSNISLIRFEFFAAENQVFKLERIMKSQYKLATSIFISRMSVVNTPVSSKPPSPSPGSFFA